MSEKSSNSPKKTKEQSYGFSVTFHFYGKEHTLATLHKFHRLSRSVSILLVNNFSILSDFSSFKICSESIISTFEDILYTNFWIGKLLHLRSTNYFRKTRQAPTPLTVYESPEQNLLFLGCKRVRCPLKKIEKLQKNEREKDFLLMNICFHFHP